MTQVQILPPAAKFLKKLKDKKLKSLYKEAIEMICEDYSISGFKVYQQYFPCSYCCPDFWCRSRCH